MRFTGSSDLYQSGGRRPVASVNFLTAHDGSTLRDLVSFDEKHNETISEDSGDGESHNRSWNCGAEGPTDDPEMKALRARQQRNFLATLFLSQGIPMLLGGDEIGRSQGGNNNGYCQDNEMSWFDWEHAESELLDFTTGVIRLLRDHPVFRQRRWFQGRVIHSGDATSDIGWYKPDGRSMSDQDWQARFAKSLGVYLNGKAIPDPGSRGERIEDDRFYLLFNVHHESCTFVIPGMDSGRWWVKVLDTNEPLSQEPGEPVSACGQVKVEGRAVLVLRQVKWEGAVAFLSRGMGCKEEKPAG